MHDQSASRISGRTRAIVSAMCVRALRITSSRVQASFTRGECHDVNAEKIQRVKCFMFTRCGICCVPVIFETPAEPAGFENFKVWSAGRKRRFISPCPVYSLGSRLRKVGMSALGSKCEEPRGSKSSPLRLTKRTTMRGDTTSPKGQFRTHTPRKSAAIQSPRGHCSAIRATPLCENPQSSASH